MRQSEGSDARLIGEADHDGLRAEFGRCIQADAQRRELTVGPPVVVPDHEVVGDVGRDDVGRGAGDDDDRSDPGRECMRERSLDDRGPAGAVGVAPDVSAGNVADNL